MNISQKTQNFTFGSFQTLILLFLIGLHICVCGFIGLHRTYLFTDEAYSYGLANSEHYSFCGPVENPTILNWTDASFFRNYLQYDKSEPFSFHAAFVNQANDVHPPLYYCLLHIVCYFCQRNWYSPIPGIVLNLCLLPIIDILLFYIAKYFSSHRSMACAALILWAFSSAGLSNAIFIRMYLLVTLWILALTAYHIFLWKRHVFNKDKIDKNIALQCIPLSLLVAAGGLTHYYFYFFAAVLGFCVCCYLLICHSLKTFFVYGISLWLGVGIALAIFPSTIHHIFGYRGNYATNSLGTFDFTKFKTYFGFINRSLTGGVMGILLVIVFLVFAYRHVIQPSLQKAVCSDNGIQFVFVKVPRSKSSYGKENIEVTISAHEILLGMVVMALLGFGYVSIQGSEIVDVRYIYPAYPLLSIFVVHFCYCFFIKSKRSVYLLLGSVIFVALFSVKVSGVDWTYSDYTAQISGKNSLEGKDCVIVCRDDTWVNVMQAINVYGIMDEVRCVYESQLDNIDAILQERETDDPVCFAFFSDAGYTDEEQKDILQSIQAKLNTHNIELSYDYLTRVYSIS